MRRSSPSPPATVSLPGPAQIEVVASQAGDDVVAVAADDDVGPLRADQGVGLVGAAQGRAADTYTGGGADGPGGGDCQGQQDRHQQGKQEAGVAQWGGASPEPGYRRCRERGPGYPGSATWTVKVNCWKPCVRVTLVRPGPTAMNENSW